MYTIKQQPEDFFVREISSVKPGNDGRFAYFILKKRNYTTVRALQHISQLLGMPLKKLGFAGTKDKNAVTEQVVSAEGVSKERIEKIKLKDISIEYLGRGDKPVSLGDLEGNFFRIVVRGAEAKPRKLASFRNLFGEQRFSRNNADVGKAIVKKDFEAAARLVMENKGDQERIVAGYLSAKPNDYVGSLRKIPLKILKMYVHAYQSRLWNRMAEKSNGEVLPIIGFGTEQTAEVNKMLADEGISSRDFIIKSIPELSSEGGERKVFADVAGLKSKEIGEKTIELEFTLPKGSYATEFIRQSFEAH